jgi:predicted DNA-binding transcriptional regulator YafY
VNYFTYSQKLEDLKYFIEKRRVKSLKDIAVKLRVSKRTALRFISRLKQQGVNVVYSVRDKSYKIISAKK